MSDPVLDKYHKSLQKMEMKLHGELSETLVLVKVCFLKY